jgi:hypothetical protein
MSLLKDITSKLCPDCGSPCCSESRRNKHINGHWNEKREFECGCVVEFSPNMMRESIAGFGKCPNSAVEIGKRDELDAAKKRLTAYVGRLKLRDSIKDRWLSSISSDYF